MDRRDGRRPSGRDGRAARLPPVDGGRALAKDTPGGASRRSSGHAAFRWLLRASDEARRRLVVRKAQRLAEEALDLAVRRARADGRPRDARRGVLRRLLGRPRLALLPRGRVHPRARRSLPTGSGWRVSPRSGATWRCDGRDPCEARCPRKRPSASSGSSGWRHLPPGDTEERIRLLGIRAGWPFAFTPERYSEPSSRSSKPRAWRERRWPSAWICPIAPPPPSTRRSHRGSRGGGTAERSRSGSGERRSAGVVTDVLEVGDLYAMGALGLLRGRPLPSSLGDRRQGPRAACPAEGRTSSSTSAPGAVASLYRLGRWDGALEEFATLRRMLESREDDPPYFATHAFGDRPA